MISSRFFAIGQLKSEWNRIYAVNKEINPTQSFYCYKIIQRLFYFDLKKSFGRLIVYHYFKEGSSECIVPLVIGYRKHEIFMLSVFGNLDYEDVISSVQDSNFIISCLQFLYFKYNNYTFQFEHVHENSILFQALDKLKLVHTNQSETKPCVEIPLPNNYSKYITRLSKHQQQNIRTAYNRIARESIIFSLQSYDYSNPINKSIWMQCQHFYECRYLSLWLSKRRMRHYRNHTLTHHLPKLRNHRIFVLYHNGLPIAYMAGYFRNTRHCFYVPRLCINNDFLRYSPGILLVNEVCKVLISEGYNKLDLMLGDEPYKIAMGGEIKQTYKIVWHS